MEVTRIVISLLTFPREVLKLFINPADYTVLRQVNKRLRDEFRIDFGPKKCTCAGSRIAEIISYEWNGIEIAVKSILAREYKRITLRYERNELSEHRSDPPIIRLRAKSGGGCIIDIGDVSVKYGSHCDMTMFNYRESRIIDTIDGARISINGAICETTSARTETKLDLGEIMISCDRLCRVELTRGIYGLPHAMDLSLYHNKRCVECVQAHRDFLLDRVDELKFGAELKKIVEPYLDWKWESGLKYYWQALEFFEKLTPNDFPRRDKTPIMAN